MVDFRVVGVVEGWVVAHLSKFNLYNFVFSIPLLMLFILPIILLTVLIDTQEKNVNFFSLNIILIMTKKLEILSITSSLSIYFEKVEYLILH